MNEAPNNPEEVYETGYEKFISLIESKGESRDTYIMELYNDFLTLEINLLTKRPKVGIKTKDAQQFYNLSRFIGLDSNMAVDGYYDITYFDRFRNNNYHGLVRYASGDLLVINLRITIYLKALYSGDMQPWDLILKPIIKPETRGKHKKKKND